SRAAVSPDGRQVAFTASYEGSPEAYVMPLAGGSPRRLSFENTRALVIGWTVDGEVLYSAPDGGRTWSMAVRAVRPDGTGRRTLPLADIGEAAIDASGRWLYAVRFGLSLTNDNARGY